MQYLVPNGTKKRKGSNASTREFEAGTQKWFFCSYGAAQLSKRMDDEATSCEVSGTLDRTKEVNEITATCR